MVSSKPPSVGGNNWTRVCTWSPALTDQLDLVAITNAPITVDLVCILGPVMVKTLLSSCLVNEVTSDWSSKDAETKRSNDDCCKCVLCFDHDAVVLSAMESKEPEV